MSQSNKDCWAVIPARGGSKRLRRKNLLLLDGLPLIARAVNTARASDCFSRILVSTDDDEIAMAATQAGAEVPFMRPPDLASDTASSLNVILHAVERLTSQQAQPDTVALIQATSPLLTAEHIKAAMRLFSEGDFVSLSSMTLVSQYPEWLFRVDPASGKARPESPRGIVAASSALPRRYIENGAIYLVKSSWLLAERSLYNFAYHGCYVMSAADSIDIDNADDFAQAEFEMARRKQQNRSGSA